MAKQISITLSDYVFDKYLLNFGGKNRSEFVEAMFVRGIEAESAQEMDLAAKYHEATQEIRAKDAEVKKLRAELGRLKGKTGPQTTLYGIYTEEQLADFEADLEKKPAIKAWFKDAVQLIRRDVTFGSGFYRTYSKEHEPGADFERWNLVLKMAEDLAARGKL